MTDWNKALEAHRRKFGTSYLLPNGKQIRLKEDEIKPYLKRHYLQLKQPAYQGSSEEEAQVGIKTN